MSLVNHIQEWGLRSSPRHSEIAFPRLRCSPRRPPAATKSDAAPESAALRQTLANASLQMTQSAISDNFQDPTHRIAVTVDIAGTNREALNRASQAFDDHQTRLEAIERTLAEVTTAKEKQAYIYTYRAAPKSALYLMFIFSRTGIGYLYLAVTEYTLRCL